MDPNLRLALLCATSDDLDDVLADGPGPATRAHLAALPLAPDRDDAPDLAWAPDHSLGRLEQLFAVDEPEDAALIRDLTGLEDFPGIVTLDLAASRVDDLGPLTALTQLEALRLTVTPEASLAPLQSLPSLRRVALDGADSPAQREILADLAARGVLVDDLAPDWDTLALPFVDRNLRLAVVNHVHDEALPERFPQFDPYALDRANLARVLALPVEPADLAAIEDLTWDEGGLAVHHLVYEQWDGEDSTFAIRDLTGIEQLPRLRRLACYTREIPAAQLDALVARDVTVFDEPFVPALAESPPTMDPALWFALQFATWRTSGLPRNLWHWSPSRRRAYLRAIRLGSTVQPAPDTHVPTVRWRAEPAPSQHPLPCLPELLREPDETLDALRIRDLRGIETARSAQVLDLPLSAVSDLAPLLALRELQVLRIAVTDDADLSVLGRVKRLTHLTVTGARTESQQRALQDLARRHVIVQ